MPNKNPSAKPEMNAISKVADALKPLDDAARQRVLRYVADMYKIRLGGHTAPPKDGAP